MSRKNYHLINVPHCCVMIVVSFLCCGHSAAAGSKGALTPACAARDAQALAAIEQLEQTARMPTAWLVDAGQAWLEARLHCLGGDEAAGMTLYERIIAAEQLPSALLRAEKQAR
ncbi:MAG: hypothetical protein IT537_06005 [Hyphomicrobiales bacterium]|nr:hypothetical protein [Hyphomicrobiales bacterium]